MEKMWDAAQGAAKLVFRTGEMELGVVAHTSKPSTWEAEAGGSL